VRHRGRDPAVRWIRDQDCHRVGRSLPVRCHRHGGAPGDRSDGMRGVRGCVAAVRDPGPGAHRQRQAVHRPVPAAPAGRGDVRADLPGERRHRPQHQTPHPTTTGKVERFHQSLQGEFLDSVEVWPDLETAQATVDAFRHEYNTDRPHQALDMAFPADRFVPRPADERLPLRLPITPAPAPPAPRLATPAVASPCAWIGACCNCSTRACCCAVGPTRWPRPSRPGYVTPVRPVRHPCRRPSHCACSDAFLAAAPS
jgi:Integrase core domain